MKKEKIILISIIGTGYDLFIAELKPNYASSFFSIFNKGIDKVPHLFDNSLWSKQKNQKVIPENIISDFQKMEYFRGADISANGQIEFAINGKRIKKYKFEDLASENSLFPLFFMEEENLILHNKINKDVVFGYQEKGQLAKFCIHDDGFNPNLIHLKFLQLLANEKPIKLLYQISYNGIILNSTKEDTVITGTILNLM